MLRMLVLVKTVQYIAMFCHEASDFAGKSIQHLCNIWDLVIFLTSLLQNCNILNQDPNTSGCQRLAVLQIISCPHISTAAVVRYLDCIQLLFECWLFRFLVALLIFSTKKENELKPATAAGPSIFYLRKFLIGSKSFFYRFWKLGEPNE